MTAHPTLFDAETDRSMAAAGYEAKAERAARHALTGMRLPAGEASDLWRTPGWLADAVRMAFGRIDLDAACTVDTSVSTPTASGVRPGIYADQGMDALSMRWSDAIEPHHDIRDLSWERQRESVLTGGRWIAYCNPPYGEALPRFVLRAVEVLETEPVLPVMLFPPRVDTRWWLELVIGSGACVRFIGGGRVAFLDALGAPIAGNSAGSCIVHWWNRAHPDLRSAERVAWVDIEALRGCVHTKDAQQLRRLLVYGREQS